MFSINWNFCCIRRSSWRTELVSTNTPSNISYRKSSRCPPVISPVVASSSEWNVRRQTSELVELEDLERKVKLQSQTSPTTLVSVQRSWTEAVVGRVSRICSHQEAPRKMVCIYQQHNLLTSKLEWLELKYGAVTCQCLPEQQGGHLPCPCSEQGAQWSTPEDADGFVKLSDCKSQHMIRTAKWFTIKYE